MPGQFLDLPNPFTISIWDQKKQTKLISYEFGSPNIMAGSADCAPQISRVKHPLLGDLIVLILKPLQLLRCRLSCAEELSAFSVSGVGYGSGCLKGGGDFEWILKTKNNIIGTISIITALKNARSWQVWFGKSFLELMNWIFLGVAYGLEPYSFPLSAAFPRTISISPPNETNDLPIHKTSQPLQPTQPTNQCYYPNPKKYKDIIFYSNRSSRYSPAPCHERRSFASSPSGWPHHDCWGSWWS